MISRLFYIIITLFIPLVGLGQTTTIAGRVLDRDVRPMQGVTITNVRTQNTWQTNAAGEYRIQAAPRDSITFQILGFGTEVRIAQDLHAETAITLQSMDTDLQEVEIVHTGFQRLKKDQMTGAVDIISEELINRSTGTDLLSRIEGLSPGILFNKGTAGETDRFLIRGRGTITADAQPLIVLDDFPYDGQLEDINPNDIASVTVLKDAAAASIWGARAGNGVIVVTTKQGQGTKPTIDLKTDIAIENRPNLYNVQQISSSDYIEFEKMRFEDGAYDDVFNGPYYVTPITPVVELLFQKRQRPNDTQLDRQIEEWKHYDVRDDMQRHLYRSGIRQQYHLGVSGRSKDLGYHVSAGYFDERTPLVGSGQSRLTLRSNTTYKVAPIFDLQHTLQFTSSKDGSAANPGHSIFGNRRIYPYAQLVDADGHPSNIHLYHPKGYIDTIGQGNLMDWSFNPVRDIHTVDNNMQATNLTTMIAATLKPWQGLTISGRYQYQFAQSDIDNLNSMESYHTRDLINRFSYLQNGQWVFPIPKGGILDYNATGMQSHQGRLQADYQYQWGEDFQLNAIAGYELRSRIEEGHSGRFYGYNPNRMSVAPIIDYVTRFTMLNTGNQGQIAPRGAVFKRTDNFLSWYANAVIGYKERVYLTGSVRKDEANLFGVHANAKGAPFWSVGLRWELGPALQSMYEGVDRLSLRASYGVNGNVSRSASALTTVQYVSYATTGLPSAILNSPPNSNLRWERVETANFGIDVSLFSGVLSATFDYYRKNGRDLLAQAPLDPTKGITQFFGNVASMNGNGWDLALTTQNIRRKWQWSTTLNLARTYSEVSEYLMPISESPLPYLSSTVINPVIGRPLYSVFSYPWSGLDPSNGDPTGYFNGKVSKEYQQIYTQTALDDMVYHGPLQSPWFGAFRNDFRWRDFGLSINISFQLGSYFRTESFNNGVMMTGFSGHSDYSNRWQVPGDENFTFIPSFDPTNNNDRTTFYRYSEVLVQRADNVRLEDILLSYDVRPSGAWGKRLSRIRLFTQWHPRDLVWLNNDRGIDPHYSNMPRRGATFVSGINLTF